MDADNKKNTNGDNSELIEYLDVKFTNINSKFLEIDKKFLLVNGRLSNMQNILERKSDKEDVNNLLNSVDAYAKKADAYFQEMVMFSHKMDRHEKWLHQVADKLGLKLEY